MSNRHSGQSKPASKNTASCGNTVAPRVKGLHQEEAGGNGAGKLKKNQTCPQRTLPEVDGGTGGEKRIFRVVHVDAVVDAVFSQ